VHHFQSQRGCGSSSGFVRPERADVSNRSSRSALICLRFIRTTKGHCEHVRHNISSEDSIRRIRGFGFGLTDGKHASIYRLPKKRSRYINQLRTWTLQQPSGRPSEANPAKGLQRRFSTITLEADTQRRTLPIFCLVEIVICSHRAGLLQNLRSGALD
jgi:hypothetical protein